MRRPTRDIPPAGVAARLIALLACSVYLLANVILVTQQWKFDDIGAYLGAADRLQHGALLYSNSVSESEIYRYAPWFAYAWIPLNLLPRLAVEVAWALLLLTATGLAMAYFRRSTAQLCLALLLGALLFRTAGWGNIQPLLVLSLMYLLPTRAGPWAVGISASLKVLPILFLAVYAWRREWGAVAIGIGVAVVLWAPALLFDLSEFPAPRGPNIYDSTLLLALPAIWWAHRRRHGSLRPGESRSPKSSGGRNDLEESPVLHGEIGGSARGGPGQLSQRRVAAGHLPDGEAGLASRQ
ncbi:MAG: glycosyltransferase 87 family protein [Chloroflexota bacterium]|nr:glycosyltransferase 87 family protein [Chloroflexota bacterium]